LEFLDINRFFQIIIIFNSRIIKSAIRNFSFYIGETCIIKVKKIACKTLKGRGVNSGLRLIYAHFKEEEKITFIELYYKNDKENEDRQRIIDNFK